MILLTNFKSHPRKFTIFWNVTPQSVVDVLHWGQHEKHHFYNYLYYVDIRGSKNQGCTNPGIWLPEKLNTARWHLIFSA
jgi:hypothetical protein